jgi:superoxide dismutase, Cu-Zn family
VNALRFAAAALVVLAACSKEEPRRQRASAALDPRSGSTVTGHASFTETSAGVEVLINVAGATPGKHGVHIHQVGDCSAADAESAGDHWNPDGASHGAPGMRVRHAGDFGNIVVGADGRGELKYLAPDLSVAPGPKAVTGHAIVIHGNADDLTSQPAGNAGPRVACGVIAIRLK